VLARASGGRLRPAEAPERHRQRHGRLRLRMVRVGAWARGPVARARSAGGRMTAALAHRATIQQLVAVYQEQCERIRRAFAEIADAERTLRSAFLSATLRVPSDRYSGRSGE